MSAETLRRAAALMRERAKAATPGPWGVGYHRPSVYNEGGEVAVVRQGKVTDTPHIASWHPAVALAVADWLDTAGADIWAHGPLCICGTGCDACDDNLWEPHARAALAVARAYLGEPS